MNNLERAAYERIKKVFSDNPELASECVGEDLGCTIKQARLLADELKTKNADQLMRYIRDEKTRDAVAAFNATLTVTQDVFGKENMTESVICKAIEAGSYVAYRAIMGEATPVPVKRY